MVVWRNYIVLFGGFYEALREVKWYNDVYLFSFADSRWTQLTFKPMSQLPRPRSGFQMILSALEDCVYIYGGYSKEKVVGSKSEGRVHEDMWLLSLRSVIVSGISSTGKGILDPSKALWQRVSRKGTPPSTRCGAVLTLYKV